MDRVEQIVGIFYMFFYTKFEIGNAEIGQANMQLFDGSAQSWSSVV